MLKKRLLGCANRKTASYRINVKFRKSLAISLLLLKGLLNGLAAAEVRQTYTKIIAVQPARRRSIERKACHSQHFSF